MATNQGVVGSNPASRTRYRKMQRQRLHPPRESFIRREADYGLAAVAQLDEYLATNQGVVVRILQPHQTNLQRKLQVFSPYTLPMSKAFTRETDADDDEDPGMPRLPAGGKNYITRARPRPPARRVAEPARRRAAQDGRDRALGREQRRPLRERRLPVRQEAAARDRPPHPLPDAPARHRGGGRPSLHHGSDQVYFGATVTYARADGSEVTVTIMGIDEADSARGRSVGSRRWHRRCSRRARVTR